MEAIYLEPIYTNSEFFYVPEKELVLIKPKDRSWYTGNGKESREAEELARALRDWDGTGYRRRDLDVASPDIERLILMISYMI